MTDKPLCHLNDLPDNEGHVVHVEGVEVAIFKTEEGVFAIANRCPHGDASLAEGWREGCTIECPLHAAVFNLRNGEPISGPVYETLAVYPLRVEDGFVSIAR